MQLRERPYFDLKLDQAIQLSKWAHTDQNILLIILDRQFYLFLMYICFLTGWSAAEIKYTVQVAPAKLT